MRLTDLDPRWMRFSESTWFEDGDGTLTINTAHGIAFLCPRCFQKNGGAVGTETILCWFRDRGVPADEIPGPGRWSPAGTGFADLTLTPSVNVSNEHWHGFITGGAIVGGI